MAHPQSPASRLRLVGLAAALLLLGLAATQQVAADPLASLQQAAGLLLLYALGGCLFLPLVSLSLSCGMLFSAPAGIACALLGSALAASCAYGCGYLLGPRLLRRYSAARRQLQRQLGSRPLWTFFALLRFAPAPPFSLISLLAGGLRLRFAPYLLGSLLGLLPQILAAVLLGPHLLQLLKSPAYLLLSAGLLVLFAYQLWRRSRQTQAAAPAEPLG